MALDSEFFCPVIRGWEVRDSEMGQGLHRDRKRGAVVFTGHISTSIMDTSIVLSQP